MTPSGDLSDLQLHQVRVLMREKEGAARKVLRRSGDFADGHGGFVAGVAAGAVQAVLQYLVAEGLTLGGVEAEVLEEGRDAGEEADALDAIGFGLMEQRLNEEATGSVSLDIRTDDDGSDLGEVLAVDMESSAAEELVGVGFDDGEGADVGADFYVGAAKEGAVMGEAIDQLMDGASIP
jgi:hypothetical protein